MVAPLGGQKKASSILKAILAISSASILPQVRADEAWIGGGTGLWSNNANWLDGSAPAAGGSSTLAVRFADLSADVQANLDLGTFSLNKITFDNRRPFNVNSGVSGTDKYQLTGAAPEIVFNGSVPERVRSIVLASSSTPLLVSGSGVASYNFNGVVSEASAGQSVTVKMTNPRSDLGTFEFDTADTFSGGVDLQSGTLLLGDNASLGTGKLTVRGGYLGVGTVTVANDIQLYHDLIIVIGTTGFLGSVISSQVAGTGLVARGDVLTLTNASTYTGETTVDHSFAPDRWVKTSGPQLSLSGAASLLTSTAYNVRSSTRLTVVAATTGATDRLSDTAPVRLQGAQLRFSDTSGNGTDKRETIGNVELAGQATVALAAGTSALSLTGAGLVRTERGTLLVAGITTGTGLTRFFLNTTPALVGGGAASGSTRSIVPFALGDTDANGSGASFLTYVPGGSGGFRLLSTTTDYDPSISAGATSNIRLTAAATVAVPTTVNSLWLAGFGVAQTGSGALAITSGALASTGDIALAPDIAFGAAEGVVSTISGTLTISGAITGTNGLTKSGAGVLALSQANPFGGPLTVAAGLISFSAANQLGAGSAAISLHGLSSGLSYSGSAALSLDRPLAIGSSFALVQATGAGDFTLSGGTSGPGGLQLNDTGSGRIVLSSAIQHADYTIFNGGRIAFSDDSWLGAGGDLGVRGAATLELGGDWMSSRRLDIAFGAALTLQTNAHQVTLSGPLTGSGSITKTTSGDVRITGLSTASGTLSFDTGTLALSGAGAIRSATINLTGGAVLSLENATQAVSTRLGSNSLLTITDGALQLQGNASTPVTETLTTITRLYNNAAGDFALTLAAPGTAGTILRAATIQTTVGASSYPAFTPPMLLSGTNLGAGPTGGFSRIVLTSTSPATGFRGGFVGKSNGVASFVAYDNSVDAAGPVGFRPLIAAEYSSASVIQNPANGGATPVSAHLLLSGPGTAGGTSNTAQTLTLEAGSDLTLAAGQTLTLSLGGLLARAGASPARIEGGMVNLGNAPLGIYADGELQIASTITASSAFVAKSGPGKLSLQDGSVIAKPLFVASGTVNVSGATALATAGVTVGPSGRLEGSAITPQSVLIGGTFAPGSGVGTFETGNLSFAGAARLELEIASPTSYDQVRVDGTMTFSGLVELVLQTFGNLPANSFSLAVLLNDGTDSINVSATNGLAIGSTVLTEGSSFQLGNRTAQITYKGGDGNDIYFLIPEPAATSLFALGAAGLLARRRRKSTGFR